MDPHISLGTTPSPSHRSAHSFSNQTSFGHGTPYLLSQQRFLAMNGHGNRRSDALPPNRHTLQRARPRITMRSSVRATCGAHL
eukprot:364760-Chlamydomonas_euryale.AAC.7